MCNKMTEVVIDKTLLEELWACHAIILLSILTYLIFGWNLWVVEAIFTLYALSILQHYHNNEMEV